MQTPNPYGDHANQNVIPDAPRDRFGNPQGSQYDLGRDRAFEGQSILVLQIFCGESFDFSSPAAALEAKGFSVIRHTAAPSPGALEKDIERACQVWIVSDWVAHLDKEHVRLIRSGFDAGKGLYLWGDNQPFYVDANVIAEALFGASMSGCSHGDQVVGFGGRPTRGGFVAHPVTTGLQSLYEGITIATVNPGNQMTPILYGSAGQIVAAAYDRDGCRAILDGGFTRLYCHWDTAGTGRYVTNAAAWLANWERGQPKVEVPALVLAGDNGRELVFTITGLVGKAMVAPFGDDAKFVDAAQFRVERSVDGWRICHCAEAANETLVNGAAVSEPVLLRNGDIVAVGRAAKGVQRLPMRVGFRPGP